MKRKLFCEISPFTYFLSVKKERFKRRIKNFLCKETFSAEKGECLPTVVYKHNSLIRRKLGNVDMELQENKAVNLAIAAPKVNRILIKPGEVFSFWKLVGNCTQAKGYKEGLTISFGATTKGIGGGMCQFTNLLHWMALHSPLDIFEFHHHNDLDLFPDFGRQVPFGCGTSIYFNYLDYRVKNNTGNTFQFLIYTTETHLCGELRAQHPIAYRYHVVEEGRHFVEEDQVYYRRNKVYRHTVDKKTGSVIDRQLVVQSNAKVLYDSQFIQQDLIFSE